MLLHLHTELEVLDSYVPRPLENGYSDGKQYVSRISSNVSACDSLRRAAPDSDIRLIISAIHDDHEQDQQEFQRYRSRTPAEDALVVELDIAEVPGQSEITGEKSPSSVGAEESNREDHPIDGAFALWQAFLVMLMVFSTWGANAAFGVFLNFYLSNDYFPGATQYEFALMGGMVVFLAQALGPVAAIGVRLFGIRPVMIFGTVLQFVAYILASFCTRLWQIFVCQGVLVGLLFSCIFIPGTLVLPTWFHRRRSLAMGIAVSGAGFGGLVFSLSVNALLNRTGNQRWPLRMIAIVITVSTVFTITFTRMRNQKPVNWRENLNWREVSKSFGVILDITAFASLPMKLVGMWFGLMLMGYVIFLFSYTAYATSVGLSHSQGSNLLAILNAAQVVGRPLMGIFGDHFGRTNASILLSLYVAIFILAMWINSTLYGALIALAILAGGPLGVGSTMAQSLSADIYDKLGNPEKLPAGWAGLNIIASLFCLPCEVIALKLHRKAGVKSYQHSQIFAGCVYCGGGLLLLINRSWLVKKTLEARRRQALNDLECYLDDLDDCGEADEKLHEKSKRATLQKRVRWYDRLLGGSVVHYFVRMFYPIRV